MDKGMIIEIDHMSYATRMQTLDAIESRSYSGVVSSHGWMENMASVRERIFGGGHHGTVQQYTVRTGHHLAALCCRNEALSLFDRHWHGGPMQGVTSQPSGDDGFTPQYPFSRLMVWSPSRNPRQATGNSISPTKVATYGMYAEWVETCVIAMPMPTTR